MNNQPQESKRVQPRSLKNYFYLKIMDEIVWKCIEAVNFRMNLNLRLRRTNKASKQFVNTFPEQNHTQ